MATTTPTRTKTIQEITNDPGVIAARKAMTQNQNAQTVAAYNAALDKARNPVQAPTPAPTSNPVSSALGFLKSAVTNPVGTAQNVINTVTGRTQTLPANPTPNKPTAANPMVPVSAKGAATPTASTAVNTAIVNKPNPSATVAAPERPLATIRKEAGLAPLSRTPISTTKTVTPDTTVNPLTGKTAASTPAMTVRAPTPDQAKGIAETGDQNFTRYATPEEMLVNGDFEGFQKSTGVDPLSIITPDILSQMSPEQQQSYQVYSYNRSAKEQKQGLEDVFGGIQDVYKQRENEIKQQIADAEAAKDPEKDAEARAQLEQLQADREAAVKTAQENANQATQSVNDTMAFEGFGRSTKLADNQQKIQTDLSANLGNIERSYAGAAAQVRAAVIDKADKKIEQLQARLNNTQDAEDQLLLNKATQTYQLSKDLLQQNPLNPKTMIETAQKLTENRLAAAKLDQEERKQLRDSARQNFQFMVTNFGSDYFKNLDDESLKTLSSNLGMPVSALKAMGPTIAEQKNQWDKLTYQLDRQDKYAILQAQQDFQVQMNDVNFKQDLQKLGINFDYDVKKLALGEQFKTAADQRKYAGLSYGAYAGQAAGANGATLVFSDPVNHPSTGSPVVAMNPKIVNAAVNGQKFDPNSGPNGLGGQCAYEVEQLTNLGAVGNTLQSKTQALQKAVAQGKGFMKGQGMPQPGDVLISSLAKTTGHVAIVNAVTADGKIVLSEWNVKPLSFTNNRTIDPNGGEVVGFIRAGLKPEYQVAKDAQKLQNDAKNAITGGNKLADLGISLAGSTGLGKLLGVVANTVATNAVDPTGQKQAAEAQNADAINQLGQNWLKGVGDQEQSFAAGTVDENGQVITPDRQLVRSGQMPDTQVFDLYKQLQEGYGATGRDDLRQAMTTLMTDYQLGKKAAQFNEAQQKANVKRPLDQTVATTLSKFTDVGAQLDAIQQQYNKLKSPDPITGKVRNLNPYDKDVQQLNRMITAVVPTLARGVFGEVGVLTDSDVDRYTKLLADVRTPKDQADEAFSFLKNRIAGSYQNYVSTFDKAGYDVGQFLPADQRDAFYNQQPQSYNPNAGAGQITNAPGFTPEIPEFNEKSDFGKKVVYDLQKGAKATDIVKVLADKNRFPQYADGVQSALAEGWSADDILKYLSNQ